MSRVRGGIREFMLRGVGGSGGGIECQGKGNTSAGRNKGGSDMRGVSAFGGCECTGKKAGVHSEVKREGRGER